MGGGNLKTKERSAGFPIVVGVSGWKRGMRHDQQHLTIVLEEQTQRAKELLTPMFHKTSRARLIFLRRAVAFRQLRISTDTPPAELLARLKNLRRTHSPLL